MEEVPVDLSDERLWVVWMDLDARGTLTHGLLSPETARLVPEPMLFLRSDARPADELHFAPQRRWQATDFEARRAVGREPTGVVLLRLSVAGSDRDGALRVARERVAAIVAAGCWGDDARARALLGLPLVVPA